MYVFGFGNCLLLQTLTNVPWMHSLAVRPVNAQTLLEVSSVLASWASLATERIVPVQTYAKMIFTPRLVIHFVLDGM